MEVVALRVDEDSSRSKAELNVKIQDDAASQSIDVIPASNESIISYLDEALVSGRDKPDIDSSAAVPQDVSFSEELPGIADFASSIQVSRSRSSVALMTDNPNHSPSSPIAKQERPENGEGLVVGASPSESALLSALTSPSGISTKEWGRMYDRASSLSAKTRVWKDLLRKYEELSRRVQELEANAQHPLMNSTMKASEPVEPTKASTRFYILFFEDCFFILCCAYVLAAPRNAPSRGFRTGGGTGRRKLASGTTAPRFQGALPRRRDQDQGRPN
jgi:hypothetical protein